MAVMTSSPPHKCCLSIDIAGEGDWKTVYGERDREGGSMTVDEVGMVEGTKQSGRGGWEGEWIVD
jgi:hypothetical protein